MSAILELSNPVLSAFAFHTCVLCIKMLLMGFATGWARTTKKVYANQEDCDAFSEKGKAKPNFQDAGIERIRRNHLNDLENIIPFVLVGIMYVLSGPTFGVAVWHFRIFTLARISHTLCYQIPLPQPSRALSHTVGLIVTSSMAIQALCMTSW